MAQYNDLPVHLKAVLDATKGTRFGAILACAIMGDDQGDELEMEGKPHFRGKGTVTPDGYLMWDLVTAEGDYKAGAFAGGWQDFTTNMRQLTIRLGWADAEQRPTSITTYAYVNHLNKIMLVALGRGQ